MVHLGGDDPGWGNDDDDKNEEELIVDPTPKSECDMVDGRALQHAKLDVIPSNALEFRAWKNSIILLFGCLFGCLDISFLRKGGSIPTLFIDSSRFRLGFRCLSPFFVFFGADACFASSVFFFCSGKGFFGSVLFPFFFFFPSGNGFCVIMI